MAAAQAPFPVTEEQLTTARSAMGLAEVTASPAPPPTGDGAAKEEEAPFSVTLNFIGGENSDVLVVRPSSRIINMKSQVCEKLGVSSARVKLLFGSSVLRWNDTAAAAGLAEGAMITVVVLPPLYEGSDVYEKVANAYRDSQAERPTDEEVRESLEQMMEKRSKLNEAFTASIKLRKAQAA